MKLESWASNIGYVVEKDDSGDYVWSKEGGSLNKCHTAGEVVDRILEDIRSSYQGER
jgi:hypothetical protein